MTEIWIALCALATVAAHDVSRHNVTWRTLLPEPGIAINKQLTYHNSMPIGNGHVAANVNYDSTNDTLQLLVAASSFWAEDGDFAAKVALLSIKLPSRDGAPLGGHFVQTFNPQDATVQIDVPSGGNSPALSIVTYVDANSDSVIVSISPPNDLISATLTAIRPYQSHGSADDTDCQSYNVSADIAASPQLVYHRNALGAEDSYMTQTLRHENIPSVPDFADPLLNRTTGALVAKILADGSATTFATTVLTAQTKSAEEFENLLANASTAFIASQTAGQFPPSAHKAWWATKWDAHWIDISASTSAPAATAADAATISQMYVLQRFIELSQSRADFPIKFNGERNRTQRAFTFTIIHLCVQVCSTRHRDPRRPIRYNGAG